MLKHGSILLLAGLLVASCSPYPPEPPYPPQPQPVGPAIAPPVTTPQPETTAPKPQPKPKPETTAPKPKPKPKYDTALAIPGREGFVFNPHTNEPVDVRGIPSGSLVTDPNDAEGRKFRVP
ncbi:MAG: hypothetical protein ACQKBY_12545 [Verrucomicrobiales bacterium]